MKEMMTWAGEQYEKVGIDIAKALKTLGEIPISLHCWQGGDEAGFEPGAPDTPGRLATPEEFQQGFARAIACIPGKKRLSLLSTYALPIDDGYRDRDALEPRQVDGWLDFARETGIGLDFSSTFICHPLSQERLTLSHPDEKIRGFWVEHGRAARRIAAYIADKTGDSGFLGSCGAQRRKGVAPGSSDPLGNPQGIAGGGGLCAAGRAAGAIPRSALAGRLGCLLRGARRSGRSGMGGEIFRIGQKAGGRRKKTRDAAFLSRLD